MGPRPSPPAASTSAPEISDAFELRSSQHAVGRHLDRQVDAQTRIRIGTGQQREGLGPSTGELGGRYAAVDADGAVTVESALAARESPLDGHGLERDAEHRGVRLVVPTVRGQVGDDVDHLGMGG